MPQKTKDTNLEKKKLPKETTKSTTKSTTKKTSSTKKETVKKSSTKDTKATKKSSKKNTTKKTQENQVIEYYDLPYRYNQTVVKILAQTPNMIFVYWDIADNDRRNFIEKYGNNFFSESRPFLLIHNETKNYDFEVEINDFANSWYLQVSDANCKYSIDLCRKFDKKYKYDEPINDYLYISSSNKLSTPNNHVLLENFNPNVTFKNVKNKTISIKKFENLTHAKNITHLYNNLYSSKFNNWDRLINNNPSSNFFNS